MMPPGGREIHCMNVDIPAPATVSEVIRYCAGALQQAQLFYGHGTDNAVDEAAALVLSAAGVTADSPGIADLAFSPAARERLAGYLHRRIQNREPAPYIIGEAWFCGLRFHVDRRVLIPRSPFAELIRNRFEPWRQPGPVRRILEIGTGSGCIAIAAALAFPDSEVLATDISWPALQLACENRAAHGLADRMHLVQANLLAGITGRFDLVLSNPPYVPAAELADLPAEYAHEPGLALASGPDGLASARRILQDAPALLAPQGLLALEVGVGWPALEAAFPHLPLMWPEFEQGGEGIALLTAAELGAVS